MDAIAAADLEAIRELKARYFRLLDTKQWAQWRGLFTDNLQFFNDDQAATPAIEEPTIRGADEFVQMVSRSLKDAVTVHQGHVPELRGLDDRHARGIWAMFDWVDDAGEGGRSLQGYGHYHERYVKGDDGQWRISELRLTRLRVDYGEPTGARPPGAVAPWQP